MVFYKRWNGVLPFLLLKNKKCTCIQTTRVCGNKRRSLFRGDTTVDCFGENEQLVVAGGVYQGLSLFFRGVCQHENFTKCRAFSRWVELQLFMTRNYYRRTQLFNFLPLQSTTGWVCGFQLGGMALILKLRTRVPLVCTRAATNGEKCRQNTCSNQRRPFVLRRPTWVRLLSPFVKGYFKLGLLKDFLKFQV